MSEEEFPKGWVCPKCGSIFAPTVTDCKVCNAAQPVKKCTCELERGAEILGWVCPRHGYIAVKKKTTQENNDD